MTDKNQEIYDEEDEHMALMRELNGEKEDVVLPKKEEQDEEDEHMALMRELNGEKEDVVLPKKEEQEEEEEDEEISKEEILAALEDSDLDKRVVDLIKKQYEAPKTKENAKIIGYYTKSEAIKKIEELSVLYPDKQFRYVPMSKKRFNRRLKEKIKAEISKNLNEEDSSFAKEILDGLKKEEPVILKNIPLKEKIIPYGKIFLEKDEESSMLNVKVSYVTEEVYNESLKLSKKDTTKDTTIHQAETEKQSVKKPVRDKNRSNSVLKIQ